MESWNVVIGCHPAIDPDAGDGDLIAALALRGGSYSDHEALDTSSFRLSVDARGPADALKRARRSLRALLASNGFREPQIVSIEIVLEEWVDRFEPEPLLGVSELAEVADVSRQRIHQLAQREDFPAPAARLASGPVWHSGLVLEWLARERPPGRPRTRQR